MSKKSDKANTKLIAEAIHDLRREVREQVDNNNNALGAIYVILADIRDQR